MTADFQYDVFLCHRSNDYTGGKSQFCKHLLQKRHNAYRSIFVCCSLVVAANRNVAMAQQRHAPDKVRAVKNVARSPFYYGKWKVIGYKVLPISALSERRARSWLGRIGAYGPDFAQFYETTCERTTFLTRKVSAADFTRDYRCKPADLGIPSGTVEVIEVDSAGHPFEAPGGVLIRRTDGKMLMFWAGVLFILQRQ